MLQDPIAKPPDVQMEAARAGSDRRNKPNNGNGPEKVLNCPRCDSINTKFCYYNNYSLTQPRHFCKNCRRYWTQGGSLRNVPIGGGCRKNKRVKQRSVDPHMFGGLEDHSGPGSFLHVGGAAGSLLSSSCFGPPGTNTVPGFGDLMPSNDSHLLSMAFSRLQESLRLGEHTGGAMPPNSNPAKLSLMHSSPLYDTSLLSYPNDNVKPEHVYNGSEMGNLFDPSSAPHLGSATASLASLQEQLTNFEVHPDHAFNACSLEAQLKMQHQKQLGLHLGGGSEHQMNGGGGNTSNSNGGSIVGENGRAHPHTHNHTHTHTHMHHRQHGALPDFEDHESPESMGGGMQMMRRAGGEGAGMMTKGKSGNGMGPGMQEIRWQQLGDDHHHHHEGNNRMQGSMGQLQLGGAGEMHLLQQAAAHQSAYHEPVSSSAADQQMISFWSPSPWNDHVHAGTPAGALL